MDRRGAILKLCAEVGEHRSALEAADHLLAGCMELAGAALGTMFWAQAAPGFFQPGTGLLKGGDDALAAQLQSWYYGRREYVRDPINRAARTRRIDGQAFTRRDVMDDAEWYIQPHIDGRRRHGGLDDVLTVAQEVNGGAVFISLHRPWGDRPFSTEERDLLSLTNSCNAWLIRRLANDRVLAAVAPSLAPRLERMLSELLTGRSEREIADALGLSPRTVHKYVELLFQELQVSSRVELMALYVPSPEPRVHSVSCRRLTPPG